jgi:hypothetical protein
VKIERKRVKRVVKAANKINKKIKKECSMCNKQINEIIAYPLSTSQKLQFHSASR